MKRKQVTVNELVSMAIDELLIDMDSAMGKRDYAIISLAATTGLRAADIIKLKLEDINWEKSELRFIQSKTGGAISLPLIEETADAIKNYILNARPESECNEIFLRIKIRSFA